MAPAKELSRRQFVASAAAIASMPVNQLFASVTNRALRQTEAAQTGSPGWRDSNWKDQGIENLTKSPHAKLRDIPVRAVTIQSGFWGQRREINVTKSIPTMHDLLEA